MKLHVIALALIAGALGSAAAAVPTTVTFSARLVDDKSEKPVAGSHHFTFELFDAAIDGKSVWSEARDVEVDGGLVVVDLGGTKPLDATVFDGKQLFLQVTVDDVAMDPRVAIDSVPYAFRAAKASDADTVGGHSGDDFQTKITGNCAANQFATAVNADGTLSCGTPAGGGDITDVLVGPGLTGGGTSGAVTVSLLTSCAPNELLKWTGSAWACAADANSGGDITGVLAGPGLVGGGTSGDVTVSLPVTCGAGQMLKWTGSAWACANDIDTNSGGDITGVSATPGGGLAGGGLAGDVSLGLITTCAANQVLKWTGSAWTCGNDNDTNSGGTITGVTAGNGLVGGGTSGAVTLDVVAGTGLTVAADGISLDTAFTDGRYVNTTGDTMTGNLDMGGRRVLNRGCPTGYVVAGPGLCVENVDAGPFTFTSAANRCRQNGTHLCTSGEMRGVMSSGITLGSTLTLDWMDDQDADDNALYVNNAGSAANPEGAQTTTSNGWSRCCANVE